MASSITNSISIITCFLFLIIILTLFVCPATASSPNSAHDIIQGQRLKKTHHPRGVPKSPEWSLGSFPGNWGNSQGEGSDLGIRYTACVNDVNYSSPNYEDVMATLPNFIGSGRTCVPAAGFGDRHCKSLAEFKSAAVYFCGSPGIDITCDQISDQVIAFGVECAKPVNGVLKEKGTAAIFINGQDPGKSLNYDTLSFLVIDSPGFYKDL